MNRVRRPAVAGIFYPAEPKKLQDEIDLLLSLSKSETKLSNLFGIVSPHAGYIYSGKTAAYGFSLLRNYDFKNVIVISPSHREYFPGISIYEGDAFETPLGIVPINSELVEKLVDGSKTIFKGTSGQKQEHAIEVQIPFLQTVLKNFSIVPIVMGDQGRSFVDELAFKISEIIDDDTIIVASSDLSHYHSKFEANHLDSIVEKRILDFDFDRLQYDLESRNCEACGGGPIVTMMKAAFLSKRRKSIVLNRSDSGDISGDNNEVVGYLSAAVYGD